MANEISFEEFNAKYAPKQQDTEISFDDFNAKYAAEPKSRSFGEVAGDVGSQLGKGVNTIAGAIPNLLDPSSPVSKFFNDNAQYWQNDQSQITKSLEAAADARIAEAAKTGQWEAFKTAVKEYGAEPALVQKLILENIPSMIPGLAAAKGAQIAAKGSVIAGTVAGAGTNSVLNAGGARQESYQDIKKTLIEQGMSEAEADAQALEKSKVAAGVGAATGALSGGSGLERGILGGAKGGFAKRAGVELGGEQLEEVAPTIATNMQLDRDTLTGVGETSAKTLIASSPGSVISGFQGNSQPVQPTPPGATPPTIHDAENIDELISATKSSIDVELDNQTNQDLLDEISASNNATSSNTPVDQGYVPQPDTEPRPTINIAPDVAQTPIIEQSQPTDLNVNPVQASQEPQPTEGATNGTTPQYAYPMLDSGSASSTSANPSGSDGNSVLRYDAGTGIGGLGLPGTVVATDGVDGVSSNAGGESGGVIGKSVSKPIYSDMSYKELDYLLVNANKINNDLDLAAIEKHFGSDMAIKYQSMNKRQRNVWWDENATEEFENDSSVMLGIDEEEIGEHRNAISSFDTSSPFNLGRSISLASRNIDSPNFKNSPEYTKVKNALNYSIGQGWNEEDVINGMRSKAAEWAGNDAPELFGRLFDKVRKPAAQPKQTPFTPLPANTPIQPLQITSRSPEDTQTSSDIGIPRSETNQTVAATSPLAEVLKPLRAEILKYKGEGKTKTGSKVFYDATDRLKAIAEDTGETSLKAQQVWFNSKRKTLEKNGDIEAAALFERIVAQLKERINTAQEPAPVKIDDQVATVATKPARETITPSEDTVIGSNAAGEKLYERLDKSRYRMRFDRKDRPYGYPDFGGDLAPAEPLSFPIGMRFDASILGLDEQDYKSQNELSIAIAEAEHNLTAQGKEALEALLLEDQFDEIFGEKLTDTEIESWLSLLDNNEENDNSTTQGTTESGVTEGTQSGEQDRNAEAQDGEAEIKPYPGSIPKTIKQLEVENKSTAPKVPTPNVFKNEVGTLSRVEREGIDDVIENKKESDLPTETINIGDIVPTQKNLTINNLQETSSIKNLQDGKDPVILVKKDGKYFVVDGHHRIANAILKGKRSVEAKVFNDAAKPQLESKPSYAAPPSVDDAKKRWNGDFNGKEFTKPERGQNQTALMESVGKALDAGLTANRKIDDFVAKNLGVTDEQRKAGLSEVEGGAFGYDVYLARKEVEQERTTDKNISLGKEFNLKVGENVGKLKLQDGKIASAATVEKLSDTRVTLTAKRGPQSVRLEMDYIGLEYAAERAGNDYFSKKAKPADPIDRVTALVETLTKSVQTLVDNQNKPASYTDEKLQFVNNALEQYGAELNNDGYITKNGKTLSVRATIKKGRLVFEGSNGNKLFSGATDGEAVSAFVEDFWKWEKNKPTDTSPERVKKSGESVHNSVQNNSDKLEYAKPSTIDTPAQGVLNQAKEGKVRAWEKVQSLRERIKNEPLGGNRSGLRLELAKAEDRHREYQRNEKEALAAIEKRANELGLTTVKSNATKFSQSTPTTNTHTVASATSAMLEAHKGKIKSVLQAMLDTGKAKVVTAEQAAGIVGEDAMSSDAQAFYNPADKATYFVADQIPIAYTAQEFKGLVLHEIAVHAKELGKDSKEFKSILAQVDMMRKAGNKAITAAFERVPKDTSPEHVTGEALAYAVQHYRQLGIVQRVMAWFRNTIRAIGKSFPTLQKMRLNDWANNLNEKDLRFMAESALKNAEPSGVQNESDTPQFSKSSQTDTPAFKKWFGDSKVVDAEGKPLRVFHGTTQTRHIPGGVSQGSKAAQTELEKIATQYGISDWGDVPNIFERLSASANKLGVTKQLAEKVRSLHRQAKSKIESPSKTELAFNVFETPSEGIELGIHFGSEKQAEMFGEPFPFYLNLNNLLRLPDLGNWAYEKVLHEARKRGVTISNAEYAEVVNATDNNEALRQLLIAKGFDGIVYKNEAEGSGDSYIAFNPTQIKSAIGNNGNFDGSSNNILFSKNTNPVTHPFQPENSGKPLDSWIKIFTRNQIVTLYRDSLIGKKLEEYKELRERVTADTNSLFEKADNFLLELRQIPKGLRDAFASLAHDSTLNNVDPSNPKYVPSPDAVKLADYLANNPTNQTLAAKIKKRLNSMEAAHKKLHSEFSALPAKEQELFKELRSKYTEQMTMVFNEFKNRIGRMKNIDPAIKASSVKKLDEQLADLLGRVYFPLYRAGNYIVKAEKAGEPTTVDHVESNFAADRLEKKLKKLGYTVSRSTRIVSPQDNKSGEALNAVRELLDKAALKGKIEGAELSQLMDDIDQTILQSLPDQSYRKSFIHRKGTKGYSDDFIRAYADAMRRGSINIANTRHGDKITTVIEDMRKDVKAASKVPGSNVAALNQVVDRVEQIEVDIRNPTSKLVSVSGKIAFAQMLGSLSNFILNITQTPLLTMPHLGAEYGYGKANLQLAMAYAKQMRSLKKQGTLSELGKWLDMRHGLVGNELDLMQQLHDSGALDLTQSFDLIDAANNPSYQENELSMNFMKVIALPQHVSEIMNRQVTALATIRLEMARSGSPLKAYHAARKAIDQTHFDYSKENRAKLMTGNTQSILFRFKQYAQQAAFLFVHTAKLALDGSTKLDSDGNKLDGTRPSERTKARKQLAGVLGMQILVAGTLGLPVFAEAAVAASGVAGFKLAGSTGAYVGVAGAIILAASLAFGDDDGEEFDVEVKKWFIKHFGEGIGSSLADGIIPRGLASRLNASELVIRRPEEARNSTDFANQWMISLLGAFWGGTVYNAGVGLKDIVEGDIAKGATKLIPVKAIKDLVTSWQWANDGMNVTNKDGEIITPVSKADIFFKSIGINPTSVVNAREYENAKHTLHNALLKKQQKALKELREETDKTKRFNAIIKYNKSAPLGYEIDSDKVRGVIAREIKYKGKPNVVTGNPVQEDYLNKNTRELRPAY